MKLAKTLSSFLIIFTVTLSAFSQNKAGVNDKGNGNIQVVKDYRLDMLADRLNKSDEVKGYRIQIHSGPRKETARKAKSQFLVMYPEKSCYEIYQQPNFIVKVGNFLTKLEAQQFLNQLREQFPNSFLIPDDIDPLNLHQR